MKSARTVDPVGDTRLNPLASAPFFAVHVLPLAALWTGAAAFDWALCALLYAARMFFITAGYHRYFSHRAFRTSRAGQLALAFGGGTAVQKGALWWAAHHRHHHVASDTPDDVHSPHQGFWWSHVGWILCRKYDATELARIPDLAHYPELRFLDRHHWLPPVVLGAACFAAGGWSALWIGFFLSTVLVYHSTFAINSLTHLFGRRRYATADTSRNSLLMALVTFGEGWHNNHHHYQASANMGFHWWQVDVSWYVLRALAALGLVWDLRRAPQAAIEKGRITPENPDVALRALRALRDAAPRPEVVEPAPEAASG